MKVIFMGTHQFAVSILEKVLTEHQVLLVVTQPDSYVGRKKVLTYSKVKECAIKHNLPVFQPEKLNKEKEVILNTEVDLIITAAYGQFIGEAILKHPKYGCINVHGSILPAYRGGAPIQRSIINGDKKTGITIQYMVKAMDAGDILSTKECDILETDTQDSMFEKLSILGSEMILPVIQDIESNTITPIKQDESKATYAYNLTKEDEIIDFNKDAEGVYNQIRGLNSNPGATFYIGEESFKVFHSIISKQKHNDQPGIIKNITKDSFDITCNNNTLITITEVLPQGKRLMSVRDYLNGKGKNIIINNRRIVNE